MADEDKKRTAEFIDTALQRVDQLMKVRSVLGAIQSQLSGGRELLDQSVLGRVPMESGSIADVINALTPSNLPELALDVASGPLPGGAAAKAVGDVVPAALFGVSRRTAKQPFFHGTQTENIAPILEEGFTRGRSGELGLPGTSLSQDPNVSKELFAEAGFEDVLGVDVPAETLETLRNLSPEDFLMIERVLEEGGGLEKFSGFRKPQAFFTETETFFPRVTPEGTRLDVTGEPPNITPRPMTDAELNLGVLQQTDANRGNRFFGESPFQPKTEGSAAKALASVLRPSARSQRRDSVDTARRLLENLKGRKGIKESNRLAAELDLGVLRADFRDIRHIGNDASNLSNFIRANTLRGESTANLLREATITFDELPLIQSGATKGKVALILEARIGGTFADTSTARFSVNNVSAKIFRDAFDTSKTANLNDVLEALAKETTPRFRKANRDLDKLIKRFETGKLAP